jgi:hypothetical protein
LDAVFGLGLLQGLDIGVGRDEGHAGHGRANHVLDGVSTAAAAADDLDAGVGALVEFQIFHLLVSP